MRKLGTGTGTGTGNVKGEDKGKVLILLLKAFEFHCSFWFSTLGGPLAGGDVM